MTILFHKEVFINSSFLNLPKTLLLFPAQFSPHLTSFTCLKMESFLLGKKMLNSTSYFNAESEGSVETDGGKEFIRVRKQGRGAVFQRFLRVGPGQQGAGTQAPD